uniref:AGBL carboxypeptidase 3 n=1 Tax=Leptobrachium leishanense TaxID=445787 RepID=A0A8C5QQR7_9ANUR
MSDVTGKEDIPSEHTSTSESESEEDLYESDDINSYDFYPGECAYNPFYKKTTQIVYEDQSGRKVPRLREPRDLYGVSSNSFLQLARWPYECEVLKEKVHHIEWNPPSPEPMYKATGIEKEPPCVESTTGKVIYLATEGSKEPFFVCSRVGGNRNPLKEIISQNCNTTLDFEARFESGNLQKVVQIGEYDYQITLRTDLYTTRHTQWYYFRVKNTKGSIPYRFTIINFMKPTSLYNHGMQPLMYSEIEAQTHHIGWHRIGEEIKYYKNNHGQDRKSYYSLSWTFTFPHSMDTCYFAYCYPYTYSNLQDYLADIANDPERSRYCKIRVLCHSLAGNMVYVLTITNPSKTEDMKKKKAVIVTARVHPGETNSSWVMKGFLDYILSNQSDACLLRDIFVFKVVPMLNPDGVIVGNYRCSLTGRDLNRNYKSKLKDSFPSVWFTRKMISRVMEEREILLYCDMHGHSRKQNVFMYGCKPKSFPSEESYLCNRIFPLMLSKNSPEKFSFSACKFKVQRSKEGTGRVVMWKMGVRNSYTLEATFCGSTMGNRRGTHFGTKDLEALGYHFCDALLDFYDPDKTKFYVCLQELEEKVKNKTRYSNGKLSFSDVPSDMDSSVGSDSSDSNGPPAHLMDLAAQVNPRKKILKSKKERNAYRKQQEINLKQYEQDEDETAGETDQLFTVDQRIRAISKHLDFPEKPKNLMKVTSFRNVLSKPPKDLFFKESSAKKVSIIYLVFNSKGEVITTKSHSALRRDNMVESAGIFNGTQWIKPVPLFKSFMSKKFPLTSMFKHCCYYDVEIGSSDFLKSNAPNVRCGCESEEKTVDTAKNPFSSSLHYQAIHPSTNSRWHKETQMKQESGEDKSTPCILPSYQKTSVSAPVTAHGAEPLKDQHSSGPAVNCSIVRTTEGQENCSSQRDTRHCGRTRENKNETTRKQGTGTISLPTVTTSKGQYKLNDPHPTPLTNLRSVHNILPKMTLNTDMAQSSSISNIHLRKKLKEKLPVHGNVTAPLSKRKLGNLLLDSQHIKGIGGLTECKKSLVGTWKDVLKELESSEAGECMDKIPQLSEIQHMRDGMAKGSNLKQKPCMDYLNNIRVSRPRLSLAPLEISHQRCLHDEII